MKALKITFIIIIGLVVIYLIGPRMPEPVYSKVLPQIQCNIENLENYIDSYEKKLSIKPDNQSRVIWHNDSLKQSTEYALLYLHGFSASWYEGADTHLQFAQATGMNAYFHRLATHGLVTKEALIDMTPDTLYNSAKEALMIAHKLGKKVVIMSTSTGGTLSLKLAADFPELIHSLILYSPNIRINDGSAFMLDKPWGLQIARKVLGSNYRTLTPKDAIDSKYWYNKYRIEAIVYLQQLVNTTMHSNTFKSVKCPIFLGYYFRDEQNQDPVVRVDAMMKMFNELGTTETLKQKVAFPTADTHVIANSHFSPAAPKVLEETIKFWNSTQHSKP
ncbi:alpha/beta hydrolase [Prolixibacteraceae bacterium JC049]|nr:alpha/beta hydrolase [Prolixibacteraceae bacterium JC049]